jgi:hypothetical protein
MDDHHFNITKLILKKSMDTSYLGLYQCLLHLKQCISYLSFFTHKHEDQLNVTTLTNYCDQSIKTNHISFMAYYIMCIITRSITQKNCVQRKCIPL